MNRISLVGLRVGLPPRFQHGIPFARDAIVESVTDDAAVCRLNDGDAITVPVADLRILDMPAYNLRAAAFNNPPADNPDRTAMIQGRAIGTAIVDRFLTAAYLSTPSDIARFFGDLVAKIGGAK